MKKVNWFKVFLISNFITTLLLLLLIAQQARAVEPIDFSKPLARMGVVVPGSAGVAAALTCSLTTAVDTCATNETSGYSVGYSSAKLWMSTRFVAASTGTICGLKATMKRVGTEASLLSKTVQVCVYAATAGCTAGTCAPTTQLSCSANSPTENPLTMNSVSTSETEYSFTGLSASVESGTNYWITVNISALSDNPTTNYLVWVIETTDCTTEDGHISTNGSSWSGDTSDRSGAFKTYMPE